MNGIIVLIVYTIIMLGVTMVFTKRTSTADESFHVGDRRFGTLKASLCIGATWIWAPALFVSAERAFLTGWPGVFWFLVPNVTCLIIFSAFAKRIRERMPRGITLSAYMGKHYKSSKVRAAYQVQLSMLSMFAAAVQLLAGGRMLNIITGLPFWSITVILAAIAFSYAQFSGIKASMTTGVLQMVIMIVTSVAFAIATIATGTGLSDLIAGFSSASGQYTSLFNAAGIELFLGFGLPSTIGLLSGPFGDQSFWQRAFAIKQDRVGRSFRLGALLFAIVPICMAIIGFVAAGSGFIPTDTGVVNLEFIMSIFPAWVLVPFMFMVISGLLSTVDSSLCSMASFTTDYGREKSAKWIMLGTLVLAILIANIPGITITYLFLLYGTQRASTLLPTVMTLLGKKLTGKGVYYGIIASMAIGLPVFAYGNIMGSAMHRTAGSLLTVLLSGAVAVLISRRKGEAA